MSDDVDYQNNPLHGLSLKNLLIELVDHYGFELLYAYLLLNCFKSNPSIDSSVNFLKKTDWAREKVEALYLYDFKSLPRASSEEFEIPPRDRIIPEGQIPGAPRVLSLEDAEQLQNKRVKKAAEHDRGGYGAKKSYAASARAHPEAEMTIVSTSQTGSQKNHPKAQLKAATPGAIPKSNLKPR
ncbi:MAG: hypothetical protein ACI90U_001610 [Pseudomonadales bacterium]|jgi:uncharacterized protein (DUF2132 family)